MDRNYYEGELICETVLDRYMTGVNPLKLFSSNKNTNPDFTPLPDNFLRELSKGCGHLLLDGHASPGVWVTHWTYDDGFGWTEDIIIAEFPKLKNKNKYPVCIVGGCHSNQINVSAINTWLDKDNSKKMWTYGDFVPECWGWWLTRKINGGSVATIGNSGLGIGWVGQESDLNGDGIEDPVCLEGLGPYQQLMFYKTLVEESDILGECWVGAQTKYLNTGMDAWEDIKTIEQWLLLGDPSLKIGGYQ
jgi:hypothetical protein